MPVLTDSALLGRDDSPIPAGSGDRFDIVFVDRDGTLNVHRPGYITDPDDLVLLPGAAAGVRALNDAGIRVVLVTNQQGMAKGDLDDRRLVRVHRRLVGLLAAQGAWLDAVEVCPHLADTCECRKPAPGMFVRALRRAAWATPTRCAMIGDQPSDLVPAAGLGMTTAQVSAGGETLAQIVGQLGVEV